MTDEPLRVLLIDDDEDDRFLLQELVDEIATARFALEWQSTWDAGLAALLEGRHAACLLDYNLGGRTGLELLQAAQEQGCRVPVIMLTGLSDRETDMRAMEAGAFDYLIKGGLSSAIVERSLRYAIKRSQALAALEQSKADLEAANRQIRENQALLVQSEKMAAVGQLAAGVAHEFNNIHSIISGYADLLLEDVDLDDPVRDKVQAIAESSQRAATITTHLLSFSGNRGGGERSLQTLTPIVRDILKIIRREYESEGIAFELELTSNALVRINPALLSQVVLNLLVNARHATLGQASKVLALRTWDGERTARLSVRDNGRGISSEDQANIFNPFFSTKGAHARGPASQPEVPGTGLGLSVCYNIVREHGGEIRVASAAGEGSTFTVALPVCTDAEEGAGQGAAAAGGAGSRAGRVLLVDDEVHVLRILGEGLRLRGCEVVTCEDAPSALGILGQRRFDVVITDLQMPHMQGPELLRRIAALEGPTPPLRFVLTGCLDEGDEEGQDFSRLGVSKVLRKPFRVNEVYREVCEAIEARRAGPADS